MLSVKMIASLVAILALVKYVVTVPDTRDRIVRTNTSPPGPLQGVDVQCAPWFLPQEYNGSTVCTSHCGAHLGGIVKCYGSSFQTYVMSSFCMTYNEDQTTLVVGACPYTYYYSQFGNAYYRLPGNVTNLDEYVCDSMNREGQLCGRCKEGYALPVYSYDLACIPCPEPCGGVTNWVKYASVTFAPLTVFYALVLTLRISANSGMMNAFVFIGQMLTMPFLLRALILQERTNGTSSLPTAIMGTTFGVWNLDLFRVLYTPFCLHTTSSLQVLALDYLLAVYPLFLIGLTFVFAKLHGCGFPPVVSIWRPFHRCLARFRNQWSLQNSLVDAFASFLLLSYVKFLSVSFDLLFPVYLYDISGQASKPYLYYDPTVEYFGEDHLPYALLALTVVVVIIIFPVVLLCVYPCRCFQRLLNGCGCRCFVLHTFMDAFQGCYKDGTNGTRDCRYFAAVYLIARIGLFAFVAATHSSFFFALAAFLVTILAIAVAVIRPYKSPAHNIINISLLLTFVLSLISLLANVVAFTQEPLLLSTSTFMIEVTLLVPIIYVPAVLMTLLCKKVLCRNKAVSGIFSLQWVSSHNTVLEESLPDRLNNPDKYNPNECTPLVPSS